MLRLLYSISERFLRSVLKLAFPSHPAPFPILRRQADCMQESVDPRTKLLFDLSSLSITNFFNIRANTYLN